MDSQSLWRKVDLANCYKFMFTILLLKLVVLTSILFRFLFIYLFLVRKLRLEHNISKEAAMSEIYVGKNYKLELLSNKIIQIEIPFR